MPKTEITKHAAAPTPGRRPARTAIARPRDVDESIPLTAAGIKVKISALGRNAWDIYQATDRLCRRHDTDELASWHAIGTQFLSVRDELHDAGVDTFCRCMGRNVDEVRLAMIIASRVPSNKMIQHCRNAAEKGGSIRWSHVRLMGAKDLTADDCDRWLERLEGEVIAHDRLAALMKDERLALAGPPPPTPDGPLPKQKLGGGRRFSFGKGPIEFLINAQRHAERFERLIDQAAEEIPGAIGVAGPTNGEVVAAVATAVGPLLDRLQRLRQEFDVVARKAADYRDMLDRFAREVESRPRPQDDDETTDGPTIDPAAVPADAAAPDAAQPTPEAPPRRVAPPIAMTEE